MSKILIKDAKLANEQEILERDVLLNGAYIERIDPLISDKNAAVINIEGSYLLPGIIDDQVHFREPGLTHKGTIATESRAALAGGITSFMEQPNTKPQTTTIEALEAKFQRAKDTAFANYSFLFGGTNTNLEELKRLDKLACSGVKLFLGSSTGNMLVDDELVLEEIFKNTDMVISAHCEDEATIRKNLSEYMDRYGDNIPMEYHPLIRSSEACFLSSSKAIALAQKTGARLHVFHVSTAAETALFTNEIPLSEKKITAEVCIHHLTFTDEDYARAGSKIKWNPAVKSASDKEALWEALKDDRFDIVATDHAPHTLEEKQQPYVQAPSGGPLVQHALPVMMQHVRDGRISMVKMVDKMCHNPAILFDIEKRGFIREGYFADLVVINPEAPWEVSKENILYHCQWSPFEGWELDAKVTHTFVNGHLAFENGVISPERHAMRLTFNR